MVSMQTMGTTSRTVIIAGRVNNKIMEISYNSVNNIKIGLKILMQ